LVKFGLFFPVLVYFTEKNLATLSTITLPSVTLQNIGSFEKLIFIIIYLIKKVILLVGALGYRGIVVVAPAY
jgi:hypothetical protein